MTDKVQSGGHKVLMAIQNTRLENTSSSILHVSHVRRCQRKPATVQVLVTIQSTRFERTSPSALHASHVADPNTVAKCSWRCTLKSSHRRLMKIKTSNIQAKQVSEIRKKHRKMRTTGYNAIYPGRRGQARKSAGWMPWH